MIPFANGKHGSADVGAKNVGTVPEGLFGGAVCTTLRVAAPASDGTAAPEKDDGLNDSCPRATPIAVGGDFAPNAQSDINAGAIVMDDSFRVSRRSWDVGVRSFADHPVPYFAGPVCVG